MIARMKAEGGSAVLRDRSELGAIAMNSSDEHIRAVGRCGGVVGANAVLVSPRVELDSQLSRAHFLPDLSNHATPTT